MAPGDPEASERTDRQKMRERAVRQLMAALTALFFTFTAIGGMFLWHDSTTRGVIRTHQVRSATADVLQALSDAETAQRSYLLTAAPRYLDQVRQSRAMAQATAARLVKLTRDNPAQQGRVRRLQNAVAQRIVVIDRIVSLSRAGDAAGAVRIVMGDESLAASAAVRALTEELDAAEARLHAEREARARAAKALLALSLVAFGLILAWLFVKMNRDIGLDREIEAEQVEQLRQLLAERELLIDEVNHRVKNSLQQVASVVRLQARALELGPAREALDKTLTRIMAVGRVHEQLYKGEGAYGQFDAGAYAEELARDLVKSLARDDVRLTTEVDSVELDMRRAAPLALVLNELVTNAVKYGCPAGRPGEIHVGLRAQGDRYRLSVSDQGDGLPKGFSITSTNTLGMRAVAALAKQLGGRLEVERRSGGATFAVAFPRRA